MKLRLGLSLFIALSVAACGGGDGKAFNGGGSLPGSGNTGLALDAGNGKTAMETAYAAARSTLDTSGLIGDGGVVNSPPSGVPKLRVPHAGYNDPLSTVLRVAADPLGPFTNNCLSSGTMMISGDIADPVGGLSQNDTINVDYTDCDDGLGEVLTGRIEMIVDQFSGNILGSYILGMDVLMIDFTVGTAEDTVISNGDALVSVNTQGLPVISMSINGSSMQMDSNTDTRLLTDYSTAQTIDTSVQPEPYTLAAGGQVTSSQLGGRLFYNTTVTFQGMAGSYPFAGELLVQGETDGLIRLIALDDMNVRLESDFDGDGTVDSTENTTWDDIATFGAMP